ncbi:MAG: DNA polymerase subunit beta [Methanobacterium sp. ERen5]|nr:MAG: DNA polymerase subunit beta [Methanobacterium sp. ERen5]
MRARPRDFIYTTDDLFFATTTYLHPNDRILSFLRYIPDLNGDRSLNSKKYIKVDSKKAYDFLGANYPDYLFDCDITGVQMMGVPSEKIERILRPTERLNEIMECEERNSLLEKVVKLADTFHDHTGLSYNKMGVSGSILPRLYKENASDIDFVIYGLKNHRMVMRSFAEIKEANGVLKAVGEDYWQKLYKKRIVDTSLSYDEFRWYESRKHNRGLIDGTLFDILQTRDWDEISGTYGMTRYSPMGTVEIECTVSNAIAAYDNPAVYKVEDVTVLNGPDVPISEVASYTHTYSGQAVEGERVVARGKLEKVMNEITSYRLIVGTTRESVGEYIKLKNLRIT